MIQCAGYLFAAGDRVLLLRRADNGLWGFPGGHVEPDEDTLAAAERECVEEIGAFPDGQTMWSVRQIADDVSFTTFARRVDAEFVPTLNDEHTEFFWADASSLPADILPGAPAAIARLGMDELGVAQSIADGTFTSPQLFCNVYLFAMRITGTGVAFRTASGEYVERDPAIFLTDAFLERCNGLAVLWGHTEAPFLNTDEFRERVIGNIFVPYIKGDEVWGVAKIYDADAAALMASEQWSTSPHVAAGKDSESVTLPGGETLLIEGKPFLLDNLAVCAEGVWDKLNPPSGVDATLGMNNEMADVIDEKDAAAPPAAAPAAAADPMTALGTMMQQMMSMLKGMMPGAPAADAAVLPTPAPTGNEDFIPGEPLPDAQVPENTPKTELNPALDSKRDEAKEGETELPAARGVPGGDIVTDVHKDATSAELDRMKKDSQAHGTQMAEMQRRVAALQHAMPREIGDDERNELSAAQARADGVAIMFGRTAPVPMINERPLSYRRRVARQYQQHSAKWKDADLSKLDGNVFPHVEADIYKDAQVAARSSTDVPAGSLMPVRIRDDLTGRTRTEWRGDINSFIGQFTTRPNRSKLSNPSARR